MADESKPRLRCEECAESVQYTFEGGLMHNYVAIADKLRYVSPEAAKVKIAGSLGDLACSRSSIEGISGTYDTLKVHPDERVMKFDQRDAVNAVKAINCALLVYHYSELVKAPGRPWTDIKYGERDDKDAFYAD